MIRQTLQYPSTVKEMGRFPQTGALKKDRVMWKMKAVKKACFRDLPLVIWLVPVGLSTVTVPIFKLSSLSALEVVK